MASRRTRWIVLVDRTSCHWLGHQLQMRDMSSIFVALCPNFTENGTNINQTPHWSARAKNIFLCKRNGKHSFAKVFKLNLRQKYGNTVEIRWKYGEIRLKYGFLQKIYCVLWGSSGVNVFSLDPGYSWISGHCTSIMARSLKSPPFPLGLVYFQTAILSVPMHYTLPTIIAFACGTSYLYSN